MNCRTCKREIWEPEFACGMWHHSQTQGHSSYELFDHRAVPELHDWEDYDETPGRPTGWYLS